MEFTTGGLLKAAVHRGMVISLAQRKIIEHILLIFHQFKVHEPPSDQRK